MLNAKPALKRLPALIDSRRLLTMLFGQNTVCAARKNPLAISECAVVAAYHDNNGLIQRLVACDLAFANSAGAALSAIPPTAANNATKSGRVADNAYENLSEVMNIVVTLLIETFGGRLELASVVRMQDASPEVLAALASDQRVKLDITIPRYDLGRIDLVAV